MHILKHILTITLTNSDFGIETRYINEILKEMATIYVRLINQYKLNKHIYFSASYYNINGEDPKNDGTELF